MQTKGAARFIVLCALILSACQSNPSPGSDAGDGSANDPASTGQPAPTYKALPTVTTVPTKTPLPPGVLFRDDFSGELQPGWIWENENPAKWSFTKDGWLQIIGEYDSLLGESSQTNLLWYPLPAGDIVITVHLVAKPFENFHQAAIFFYEDPENYITLNRGYCSVCPTGGNGIYMDYKIGGEVGGYRIATDAEDLYLRLESAADTISGYYAFSPDQWERLGRFGNYFQFKKVGIGVSNARAASDVIGEFDFFEVALP